MSFKYSSKDGSEYSQNESSDWMVSESNSIEQMSYGVERVKIEEVEENSPSITLIDIENRNTSVALEGNFEGSHEILVDTMKFELVSTSKCVNSNKASYCGTSIMESHENCTFEF